MMRFISPFILPFVILLVLAGSLYEGVHLYHRYMREGPSPLIGKPAPTFNLPQLQDTKKSFTPEEMKGKVWLLNAWASWCVTCREEHPLWLSLAQQKIVPIYGIDFKDKKEDAETWLRQAGNPFTLCVTDKNGSTGNDWGVYAVPQTYIIDKQGIIRYKLDGPVTPVILREWILPLIAELQSK